jgi:hypothetical protein
MTRVKQSSQRHPIFESESSQRHLIFESESSPSLKKKVTRVDSSPSHDSDSPISDLLAAFFVLAAVPWFGDIIFKFLLWDVEFTLGEYLLDCCCWLKSSHLSLLLCSFDLFNCSQILLEVDIDFSWRWQYLSVVTNAFS